jgi:hypothetical protein
MAHVKMKYIVNNTTISYDAHGENIRGEDVILLNGAIDLTVRTTWAETGFSIEKLFSSITYPAFADATHKLLSDLWRGVGLKVPDNFPLDQYHTLVSKPEEHRASIDKTRLLAIDDFPLGADALVNRVSEICQVPLIAKNPYDGQSIFHFRVIRPNSTDNNPLHRDVWLEDFDDCINLYIPVAGSNDRSSLILIPGSHHWPESRIERTKTGAMINGIKFNVPAVTSIDGPYPVVRPDPVANEILVFSPYLIHGGSVNLNPDKTRISIEMRLWRK